MEEVCGSSTRIPVLRIRETALIDLHPRQPPSWNTTNNICTSSVFYQAEVRMQDFLKMPHIYTVLKEHEIEPSSVDQSRRWRPIVIPLCVFVVLVNNAIFLLLGSHFSGKIWGNMWQDPPNAVFTHSKYRTPSCRTSLIVNQSPLKITFGSQMDLKIPLQ